MSREEIQSRIAAHAEELRALGVSSLELFGSTVRGQEQNTSDIDLLVEFSRPVGFYTFFEVQEYLEKLLECGHVDLVPRKSVREEYQAQIYAEAVPVL